MTGHAFGSHGSVHFVFANDHAILVQLALKVSKETCEVPLAKSKSEKYKLQLGTATTDTQTSRGRSGLWLLLPDGRTDYCLRSVERCHFHTTGPS